LAQHAEVLKREIKREKRKKIARVWDVFLLLLLLPLML
jgi:hypothetical protein